MDTSLVLLIRQSQVVSNLILYVPTYLDLFRDLNIQHYNGGYVVESR